MVQKCFDPRSDGQRWGPVGEDDCEVDQMNTRTIELIVTIMIAWYNPPLSDQQKYPPYQFTDHQSDSGARDGDPRETWSNYCVGLHLQVAFKSISMEISREVIRQVK